MERIKKILELLEQSPSDNFLRHVLALEYIKTGNTSEAQTLFESILKDSPEYTGSYYHLAKLLERNGDTENAIAWYKKGMEETKKINDMHTYNELQAAYEDLVD